MEKSNHRLNPGALQVSKTGITQMTMKTKFLLLIMLVGVMRMFAQEVRPSMAEKQALKMKSNLELTEEQFARVRSVNEQFHNDHSRLLADTTLTKEEILIRRKRMMEKREKDIGEILTKEQNTKWAAMKRPERRRGPSGITVATGLEDMKEALDLTDDQAKKISDLTATMAGQMKKVRMDTTMTRESTATAMKAIIEVRRTEIKKLLTEDQYEKFLIFEQQRRRYKRPVAGPPRH